MLRAVLDVLFPERCVACGARGWPFCGACEADVTHVKPPWCERCGRPLPAPAPSCRDCPPPWLARARAAFVYDGPVRQALMNIKFGGRRAAARALAPALADLVEPGGPDGTVVTWVPLGRVRKQRRGFDQAEALARAVGPLVGLPVTRLLARRRDTPPQAKRSRQERRGALREAFVPVRRPPERVFLVDDVLTTGATAAECARVLRLAGAREVSLLAAARSFGA